MKPLLSKVSRPLLIYVFSILLLSIPIYYFAIQKIWEGEIDEHNRFSSNNAKNLFSKVKDNRRNMDDFISYWNQIQLDEYIEEIDNNRTIKDTVYTADAQQAHIPRITSDNFRVLITSFSVNGKNYFFRKATSYESTRKTVLEITLISFACFTLILIGIIVLQRHISISLWKPFDTLLKSIKLFNLNNHQEIAFPKTNITEFEELSKSVQILTQTNISVYKAQKEFTENASHELQTPLAIIRNKMELLLQDEKLTDAQHKILEDMNHALIRSSRINKSLLLLARIENHQYNYNENVDFQNLIKNSIELLQESFLHKNIQVTIQLWESTVLQGNAYLTEALINNLLTNTIRHSSPNASVVMVLENAYFEIANTGTTRLDENIIFKRFKRNPANNNGSGLGLTIVKEICQLHKWEINYSFTNGMHRFRIIFNP